MTHTLRLSPNAIAHLLAIATFIFIVAIALGMGRPARAATLEYQMCSAPASAVATAHTAIFQR